MRLMVEKSHPYVGKIPFLGPIWIWFLQYRIGTLSTWLGNVLPSSTVKKNSLQVRLQEGEFLPSVKRTVRTWKLILGMMKFRVGTKGLFSRAVLLSLGGILNHLLLFPLKKRNKAFANFFSMSFLPVIPATVESCPHLQLKLLICHQPETLRLAGLPNKFFMGQMNNKKQGLEE